MTCCTAKHVSLLLASVLWKAHISTVELPVEIASGIATAASAAEQATEQASSPFAICLL